MARIEVLKCCTGFQITTTFRVNLTSALYLIPPLQQAEDLHRDSAASCRASRDEKKADRRRPTAV